MATRGEGISCGGPGAVATVGTPMPVDRGYRVFIAQGTRFTFKEWQAHRQEMNLDSVQIVNTWNDQSKFANHAEYIATEKLQQTDTGGYRPTNIVNSRTGTRVVLKPRESVSDTVPSVASPPESSSLGRVDARAEVRRGVTDGSLFLIPRVLAKISGEIL